MPPAYVKPYVRRQKNDAADAAGICEAVTRPSMRFVGVRALENQAALMHREAREMLVAQRTQLINALRGHLAKIGVIAAQGLKNTRELARVILAEGDETNSSCARRSIEPSLRWLERRRNGAPTDDHSRLGPGTASAMVARVQDVSAFSGTREFAAFLGLTPRQNSSGGKERYWAVSRKWAIDAVRENCLSWARMRSSIIASHTKTRCDPCGAAFGARIVFRGRWSKHPLANVLLIGRKPI